MVPERASSWPLSVLQWAQLARSSRLSCRRSFASTSRHWQSASECTVRLSLVVCCFLCGCVSVATRGCVDRCCSGGGGLCPAQVHVGCRPRQICPFSCLGKVHCSTTLNLFQSHIVCALCKRAQTHKPSASIFQTVLARWLIRDTCAFRHRSDRLVQGGCCKGQGGALHRQELRAGAFQC